MYFNIAARIYVSMQNTEDLVLYNRVIDSDAWPLVQAVAFGYVQEVSPEGKQAIQKLARLVEGK